MEATVICLAQLSRPPLLATAVLALLTACNEPAQVSNKKTETRGKGGSSDRGSAQNPEPEQGGKSDPGKQSLDAPATSPWLDPLSWLRLPGDGGPIELESSPLEGGEPPKGEALGRLSIGLETFHYAGTQWPAKADARDYVFAAAAYSDAPWVARYPVEPQGCRPLKRGISPGYLATPDDPPPLSLPPEGKTAGVELAWSQANRLYLSTSQPPEEMRHNLTLPKGGLVQVERDTRSFLVLNPKFQTHDPKDVPSLKRDHTLEWTRTNFEDGDRTIFIIGRLAPSGQRWEEALICARSGKSGDSYSQTLMIDPNLWEEWPANARYHIFAGRARTFPQTSEALQVTVTEIFWLIGVARGI